MSVDVSQCYSLVYLDLWNNDNVHSVDVSNSPNLEYLDLSDNETTSLDVTNNPNLLYLNVACIDTPTIDLSQNTLLKELRCGCSSISYMDFSANINLEKLNIYSIDLTNIDITNNINLKEFAYGYDGDPYDPSIGVTELDLTHNIALERIDLTQCNIQTIDLSNCPNLNYFDLHWMYNLQHFSVKNGNNHNVVTKYLTDYEGTPDPLYCIEVDDPVKANAMQPPYHNWNFLLNEQYTCSDDCGLTVDSFSLTQYINVFPNPATDTIFITNDSSLPINTINIYNQLGKLVLQTTQTESVNISTLTQGVFLVKILMLNGQTLTKKIIKK